MELLRSLLFVPGNRLDMLSKAADLDADVLVPDLEDSVPDHEKINARNILQEKLKSLAESGRMVIPRVNSLDSGLARDDLTAVVSSHIYGVTVGKIDSAWAVEQVAAILNGIENSLGITSGHTRIIPWLESAKAIINAYQIASASPRIIGVAFGSEDYTTDMAVSRTDAGLELAYARATVGVAARAAGVIALDTPYVKFKDLDGLGFDIEAALALGYKGKFAIHPGQLDLINNMFSPSIDQIEYAKKVVDVFEKAELSGSGATSLDGKLIDVPVVKRARNLLAMADFIRQNHN